jgi:hypothetical protein
MTTQDEEISMTKTIPEMAMETRMLRDRLAKSNIGDVITYSELSDLIGQQVQDRSRGHLNSAVKSLLTERQMVFGTIRTVGLKRLSDGEIVAVGDEILPRIRRMAKRATQKLLAVADFNSLTNDQKVRHNAVVSSLATVSFFSKEARVKEIEKQVGSSQPLPVGKVLGLFKS